MARRARRLHSPAFKAKVTLAALKAEKTPVELAQQYDVHANQIFDWKARPTEGAAGLFGGTAARPEPAPAAHLTVSRPSQPPLLWQSSSCVYPIAASRQN
jgi:transposase